MSLSAIKNSIVNTVLSDEKTVNTQVNNLNAPSVLSGTDNITASSSSRRFTDNKSLQEVISGKKNLTYGSKGDDVKLIQNALKDMGFFIGEAADGKYGNQTVTAIKNFQSNRSLPQTGIMDKNTMSELDKIAPPANKNIWDKGALEEITGRTGDKNIVPSNRLDNRNSARVVIDLSEHRLFYYNQDNSLNKVYSIASGKDGHEDGRGGKTPVGLKKVNYKDNDPSKVAEKLWPESKGKAFGTKLIDLSWYDLKTGKKRASGEELHGTYVSTGIGADVSHGCMRMLNKDIEELFSQIKVGDLVKVQE